MTFLARACGALESLTHALCVALEACDGVGDVWNRVPLQTGLLHRCCVSLKIPTCLKEPLPPSICCCFSPLW